MINGPPAVICGYKNPRKYCIHPEAIRQIRGFGHYTRIVMRIPLITFLTAFLFSVISCDKPGGPPTLERAWLGEGTFSVSAGSKPMKAQLEILTDGTYRFMILEPRILMLTGIESGTWTRDGQLLTLQPVNEKAKTPTKGGASTDSSKDSSSVLKTLRQSSPKNLRVKKLNIAADLSSLSLSDGPLDIEFKPNPEVTQKLKQSGEIE